jgi:CRISPR-associated protein Cas2
MRRYIVTYDISDPKRLDRIYRVMKGAGQHIQLSVFCCDLSDRQRERLILDLLAVIHAVEDQVLLIDIGPTDGVHPQQIQALGRSCDIAGPVPVIA